MTEAIPGFLPDTQNAARIDFPYAFVPENHDYGPSGKASTRDTFMSDYFLFDDCSNRPNFGGAMNNNEKGNSYHFFQAGGYEWIVVALEWGPRDNTIAWADSILSRYPDKKAILATHAYMNKNDLRYDISNAVNPQPYNPHNYTTTGGVNDGEELWQKLIKKHNFVLTVNGAVLGDKASLRVHGSEGPAE